MLVCPLLLLLPLVLPHLVHFQLDLHSVVQMSHMDQNLEQPKRLLLKEPRWRRMMLLSEELMCEKTALVDLGPVFSNLILNLLVASLEDYTECRDQLFPVLAEVAKSVRKPLVQSLRVSRRKRLWLWDLLWMTFSSAILENAYWLDAVGYHGEQAACVVMCKVAASWPTLASRASGMFRSAA